MFKPILSAFALFAICFITSCKKSTDPIKPELEAVSIVNVSDVKVNGYFLTYLPCDTSNYISIPVQVNTPGPWVLETQTVNGVKFSGSGEFSSTGPQTIKLFGAGTPGSSEASNFIVKLGSTQTTVSFKPIKTFVDLIMINMHVVGYEAFYPQPSTWVSGSEFSGNYPTCQIYNVQDLTNTPRLFIEYKNGVLYSEDDNEVWNAYASARHPIEDINHLGGGFKFRLKNADSFHEFTSEGLVHGDDEYVEILSRGTFNTNVGIGNQIVEYPVYVVKIKFRTELSDGSTQQTVSGTAVVMFHSTAMLQL